MIPGGIGWTVWTLVPYAPSSYTFIARPRVTWASSSRLLAGRHSSAGQHHCAKILVPSQWSSAIMSTLLSLVHLLDLHRALHQYSNSLSGLGAGWFNMSLAPSFRVQAFPSAL